ncbi:MAG: hypothetical protein B7Y86_16275 [Brevundimonas subvibrioides]|uniref:Bacteriocin n=1 Tax=Brevundimonas subvibrioides TaxID=74313 RepID=A0A258HBS8_9CAUL|nr:hypothetical protein [Brevundimonas subvibrioides]OYX54470.1 MAG: hypothetical protein B7Y86_16275 [Brevundimonas subvibrioides]
MTALAMDVRELTFDEIDFVSGGNWFSSLGDAIAAAASWLGRVVEAGVDWFFDTFTVSYNSENDGWTITSK